jgi:hypothetical protein
MEPTEVNANRFVRVAGGQLSIETDWRAAGTCVEAVALLADQR